MCYMPPGSLALFLLMRLPSTVFLYGLPNPKTAVLAMSRYHTMFATQQVAVHTADDSLAVADFTVSAQYLLGLFNTA